MAQRYQHFCPVARALEKIGEKWSLLIIRDLLRGPQRFTDLLNYLNSITPTWLTQRLREMEKNGIIERDCQPGRREVWYRLTAAGQALEPVVEAVSVWGLQHAMRPPVPGEAVHPELLMSGFTKALNRRKKRLTNKAHWTIQFPLADYTISFSEDRWQQKKGKAPDADLVITTTPESWATLTTVTRDERDSLLREMKIQGKPEQIEAFYRLFGGRN